MKTNFFQQNAHPLLMLPPMTSQARALLPPPFAMTCAGRVAYSFP
jgi:hypothetical protein